MPAQDYDVLIIGSGASGGMAANTLTKQGVNCRGFFDPSGIVSH